ncbi:MAG: trypsin-like serine protease [Lysobacteraceae bacterium]
MRNISSFLIFVIFLLSGEDCMAVEGGFNVSGDRWDHAVQITSPAGSCSATIVAKGFAITAAHCVARGDWSAKVYRGNNLNDFMGVATLAYIDNRYSKETYNYDVAVLALSVGAGDLDVKNKVMVQSSRVYLEMLNAKSPYRTGLVVGHGLDERDRIGVRKAALVDDLVPNVGKQEFLWGSYRPTQGATRPGDSGGGVYMLRQSQPELVAVVSGGSSIQENFKGDTYETSIERYSPVAPSLCKAPLEIQASVSFDATECAGIEHARKLLSEELGEADLPLLLHMMRMLNDSPQLLISGNPHLEQELALRAMMLGARSDSVIVLVESYLDRRMGERNDLWKKNVEVLGNYLIDNGYMRKSGARSGLHALEIEKFLKENRYKISEQVENDYRAMKSNGAACEYDNCFWRNMAGALWVSSEKGDWADVFPPEYSGILFEPPRNSHEISELVCLISDYLVLGKGGLESDLLRRGISQADLSSFDSKSKREIKFKKDRFSLTGALLGGGRIDIIFSLSMLPEEVVDSFSEKLKSLDFSIRNNRDNAPGFLAEKGLRDAEIMMVDMHNTGQGYFSVRWTLPDIVYSERFNVFGCAH